MNLLHFPLKKLLHLPAMTLMNLQFQDSTHSTSATCTPLALFSIIDHYIRCDVEEKSIGLVLGTKHNNSITMKQTIPLKYSSKRFVAEDADSTEETEEETEGYFFDWELVESMVKLQSQITNDDIVGWYLAGGSIYGSDSIVHQLHQQVSTHVTGDLVFLFLDIDTLSSAGEISISEFPIQAFSPAAIGVDEAMTGFVEIHTQLLETEECKKGLM
jgi:hypothetical protein